MSSLWTPDGERPVRRPTAAQDSPSAVRQRAPAGGGGGGSAPELDMDEKEMAAQVEAMRAELVNSPVEVVVANHCYGLFELAAVYLSQVPPLLAEARLAIDALGTLVGGLEGRLGEAEDQLRDGLSQLRLAYVQIDGARRAGSEAASAAGANGGTAAGSDSAGAGDAGTDTSAGTAGGPGTAGGETEVPSPLQSDTPTDTQG